MELLKKAAPELLDSLGGTTADQGQEGTQRVAESQRKNASRFFPSEANVLSGESGCNCKIENGTAQEVLPCLKCNNSIGSSPRGKDAQVNRLTSYNLKQSYILQLSVERLIRNHGLDYVGFLTLTFPDNKLDNHEASRRFNSLNNNFLKDRSVFGDWICVKERQKRGSWHYHLLIVLNRDIRSGINWRKVGKSYRHFGFNPFLRMIWAELRENLPKYGFGRSELLPIRTNGEGIAKYLSKYIGKHIANRKPQDRGVRLVTYSRGWLRDGLNFQWNSAGAKKWREAVAKLAEDLGFKDLVQFTFRFGRGWARSLMNFLTKGYVNYSNYLDALSGTSFPFGANDSGIFSPVPDYPSGMDLFVSC